MIIVYLLAIGYLIGGLWYAIFLQKTGYYSILLFPINVLVGPPIAIYIFIVTVFQKNKRMYMS